MKAVGLQEAALRVKDLNQAGNFRKDEERTIGKTVCSISGLA
jgi:hypothetical protein